MDSPFAFLSKARPASLFRLLEKLPGDDVAVVLAGLPAGLGVQVMAFFPEKAQAGLLPAMREARQAPAELTAAVAERVRGLIAAAKAARDGVETDAPPTPPRPANAPPSRGVAAAKNPYVSPKPPAAPAVPPPRPSSPPPAAGRGGAAGAKRDKPAGPVPWVPRPASGSPINGPAVPGTPPPVSGDPLASPLAKAGLMDLIGRAQEKLLPKTPRFPEAARRPGSAQGKRPAPREGVAASGKIAVNGPPRVVGPRAEDDEGARPPRPVKKAGGWRRMDGKVILAAILREAGKDVRDAVEHEDPSLYRELRKRMFYFDDLIYTEDAALARVFTAAPAKDAALALQFAAPALRERVLRAVSPGRAAALRDVPGGRTGVDAIETAQNRVLGVALQLQAAGRILIDPRDPDLA